MTLLRIVPKRVQRKRTKGFRLPVGCVYVGRPTKWGNPYRIGDVLHDDAQQPLTREDTVMLFKAFPAQEFEPTELAKLRGKDLACWCPLSRPCHADVLLEIANA